MTPRPGDFGLVKIKGLVGAFVTAGQWFLGDFSKWTHAFVLLDDGTVIEAMPQGAQIVPLSHYDGREILWSNLPLTQRQRRDIVSEARSLVGTPYSFADYGALFVERLGVGWGLTKDYVTETGHLICSQLVDEVYKRAGVHLFDDGRLSQDVTPGDLAILLRNRK